MDAANVVRTLSACTETIDIFQGFDGCRAVGLAALTRFIVVLSISPICSIPHGLSGTISHRPYIPRLYRVQHTPHAMQDSLPHGDGCNEPAAVAAWIRQHGLGPQTRVVRAEVEVVLSMSVRHG